MSQRSKSRSGLGTFKRDFSQTAIGASQGASQDEPITIDRPPSPPPVAPKLTGMQLRMKAIEDALNGNATFATASGASQPLVESRTYNKRPSGPALFEQDDTPSQKKKRQLPPSWSESEARERTARKPTSAIMKSQVRELSRTSSSIATKRPAGVFLSQEQSQILQLVEEGTSVFYTGSAGTGKSVLLREIIKTMKKKHKAVDAVAITASTGIAACNIGGVTVHSFAGFGLGLESAKELAAKARKNKKAFTRWTRTKLLIIDEISMVDSDLFDKLAEVGSILRKSPLPFGGIQIVVTGDFFQLPPVTKSGSVKFAFEAAYWSKSIQRTFNLTQVFRQKDPTFVNMLNEMRFGRLTAQSIAKFRSLSRNIAHGPGLESTELFPRREDVDRSNNTRLNSAPGESRTYTAIDSGAMDGAQREKLLSNFMAPPTLTLRSEAQVMLIKNVDENLVNGSMGRVVRFCDPATYGENEDLPQAAPSSLRPASSSKSAPTAKVPQLLPLVEFVMPNGSRKEMLVVPESFKVELPNGEIQAARSQLPLILAWAMSIHKSQGQTLDRVKVDLGKVFEKGQAYVALSRATSLDGLQVLNFNPAKVQAHPKVIEWSRTLETITTITDEFEEEASWTL